jgi:hypothetical protein
MPKVDKQKIAASFPEKTETHPLNLELSAKEFKFLEDGIFSRSMDEKWNIFVFADAVYFARSWTGLCFYKVFVKRQAETVMLTSFQVNCDENHYKSKDVESDTVLLKQLLQRFLNREDFYSDPQLKLPLIKKTIDRIDPNNECKKTIELSSVGLTRQINDGLCSEEQRKYFDITGWAELKEVIANKNDNEPLMSLYLYHRQNKSAITYYLVLGRFFGTS